MNQRRAVAVLTGPPVPAQHIGCGGLTRSVYAAGLSVLTAWYAAVDWTPLLRLIRHGLSASDVLNYSPSLADKVGRSTTNQTFEEITDEIAQIIHPPGSETASDVVQGRIARPTRRSR